MNWQHIFDEGNRLPERKQRMMQNVESCSTGQHVRLQFDVAACNRKQKELLQKLKASALLGSVISLGPVELE